MNWWREKSSLEPLVKQQEVEKLKDPCDVIVIDDDEPSEQSWKELSTKEGPNATRVSYHTELGKRCEPRERGSETRKLLREISNSKFGEEECGLRRESRQWNLLRPPPSKDSTTSQTLLFVSKDSESGHDHRRDCLDKNRIGSFFSVAPKEPVSPKLSETLEGKALQSTGESCLPGYESENGEEDQDNSLSTLLGKFGLEEYVSVFKREKITVDDLSMMEPHDFREIGIHSNFHITKLRQLSAAHTANYFEQEDQSVLRTRYQIEVLLRRKHETRSSRPVEHPSQRFTVSTTRITDFFRGPASQSISKGKPATQCAKTPLKKPDEDYRSATAAPRWAKIPGTQFIVDGFKFWKYPASAWFLTHFHADHYTGLSKRWRGQGLIYCTPETAGLVTQRLGIPSERMICIRIGETRTVDNVRVTFLDANHCPGAAMIVFQLTGGRNVLHTGDFRFHPKMRSCELLALPRFNTVILDTTYCKPEYVFPEQEKIIKFVVEVVRAEAFNTRTLFLFGTYTIGKEKVFLAVAEQLKKKICLSRAKLSTMNCLDIPPETREKFTTNPIETPFRVVPMQWLTFQKMTTILKEEKPLYNCVIGFAPTGWSKSSKREVRRTSQGSVVKYNIPYSEHSSYKELQEFLRLIDHVNVIPLVKTNPELLEGLLQSA